jgi:hypothetical protein
LRTDCIGNAPGEIGAVSAGIYGRLHNRRACEILGAADVTEHGTQIAAVCV